MVIMVIGPLCITVNERVCFHSCCFWFSSSLPLPVPNFHFYALWIPFPPTSSPAYERHDTHNDENEAEEPSERFSDDGTFRLRKGRATVGRGWRTGRCGYDEGWEDT